MRTIKKDMLQRAKPAGQSLEERLRAAIAFVHKGPPQSFSTLFSVEQTSIAEANEPQRTQRGKAATEAARATAEYAKYAKAASRRISSQVANNFDDCSAENAKEGTYF
jgi:hypothetical protein